VKILAVLFVSFAKGKLLLSPQCSQLLSSENFPVYNVTESKYTQTDAIQTYYLKFH